MHRNLKRVASWFVLGVVALALSACGGASSEPPKITITAPESGSLLTVGQSIAIVSSVEGEAISQVDVLINNAVYATLKAPDASKGVPNFPVNVPWTPLSAGNFIIQIRAYGPPDNQLLAQSEPLVVTAEALAEPTSAPPPTPETIPTAAPQPNPAAGQSPQAGADQPTPSAPADAPSLTVTNEFVNVRTGPGTGYDKIGELKQGQTVAVRGKSQDGKWWQIAFPAGAGGVGWVIGDYVQPNAAAANVPVAAAPPLPQRPAPPAAPQPTVGLVPLVPLATPTPAAPPAQRVGPLGVLRVEQNPIPPGGTAFAFWSIPNFRDGEFDKGDGKGYVPPIAGTMRVEVPGVLTNRQIKLRWRDLNGNQQEDTLTIVVSTQASGGGLTRVGPLGVLRVEQNPIPQNGMTYAFWTIPNFRDGEFDKGDGQGYKGPIAQTMRVEVPGVFGTRQIKLRWRDLNGNQQEDMLTIVVDTQATAYPECNEANPDWQAGRNGNPAVWTFCKRKDLEYVGNSPGNIAYVNPDQTFTMAWEVYGLKAVSLVFESDSRYGPRGEPFPGRSLPTTGTGPLTFRAGDIGTGCFRITLRVSPNRPAGQDPVDFGEKIMCIGVSPPGGGGGGGGGGGTQPTATPAPPTPTPIGEVSGPTPEPTPTPIP